MLLEEFYPPLNTFSVPNNTGALIVPSGDINAWQAHQRKQTGARMLAVAAVLKDNLTSVSKLRLGIAAAIAASASSNTSSEVAKDESAEGGDGDENENVTSE